jgi:hypothetical protein
MKVTFKSGLDDDDFNMIVDLENMMRKFPL